MSILAKEKLFSSGQKLSKAQNEKLCKNMFNWRNRLKCSRQMKVPFSPPSLPAIRSGKIRNYIEMIHV